MTHANVFVSSVINAPADRVWQVIRNFNALPDWHPLIAESRIEAGATPDQIGCVRNFRLIDGGRIREKLLALSDFEMFYVYSILESPMAVQDYVATLRLIPITDGNLTFAEWSARFVTDEQEEAQLVAHIGDNVFQAGFNALKSRLSH